MDKKAWLQWYLGYLKDRTTAPTWVYQFTDEVSKDREEFYQHFRDLPDLEKYVWEGFMSQTLEVLSKDQEYLQYTAPEKLLSFYYTLLEVLSEHREAAILILERGYLPLMQMRCLKSFKEQYLDWMQDIVAQAIAEGSMVDRMPFTDYYRQGLWLQCCFVLQYWKSDHSKDSVHTDAVIEKAVALSFELLGHNALDSLLGMGKFLYQTWWVKNK